MEMLALVVEVFTAGMTLGGMAYGVLALWGARSFEHETRRAVAGGGGGEAAGVSVLKPVRGVDTRMYAGLVSHCVQAYAGEYELVFGVSSVEDAAVAEIARLRVEFPEVSIQLVTCPERMGANGKVSNLAQMLPHARYEHVVVNDSDIRVSPRYLERVMAGFGAGAAVETQIPFGNDNKRGESGGGSRAVETQIPFGNDKQKSGGGVTGSKVGLVTVPYRGRAEGGVWSKMEALGIATDFMAGVLTARRMEGGVRFGLGSTLATTKAALASVGGFEALADDLADDYELGARLSRAGYRVELVREVVETSVPAYTLRGFCEHQMRWARSTRDSRRAGYAGLGVTYVVPWAMAAVVASGGELWAVSMLSVALLVRMGVALTVGVGILGDGQVLRDVWLLPLRDCFGLCFWAWSYASDEVVWRGERFRLKRGRLKRV